MSDLSMYEFDDIIWDDFDQGDDHMVPHPTNARTSKNSYEGDICKKPRHETTHVLNNTENLDVLNTFGQGKSEGDIKPLDKKKNVLNSASHAPPGVFGSSGEGEIVTNTLNSASESGDLLYYGWPDVGNFGDVDNMLRSCDSSFGLGVSNNDDGFGWFTSHQVEGTEEALKMDFKFPCPEPSGLNNILKDNDSPGSNKSGCNSETKDGLSFKDQINLQKKQSKYWNQRDDKKSGQGIIIKDDDSFNQTTSDLTSRDCPTFSNNTINQVLTSVSIRDQYKNLEPDYFGHMRRNTPHLPFDYSHQTTARPMVTDIKSGDPSTQTSMMFQSSKSVLVSAENEGRLFRNELENQSDVEGVSKGADIGSSNAPERSSNSSKLDEMSLEAASYRQLRLIMEQLDLRTKLCIRDSLYRLAKSAEQRQSPSLSSSATDINDLGGPLLSVRANKCTGFMDMETDTNPIDRSVAHLLFHRPAESPNLPSPLSPKLHINHGSIPSMRVDKLVYQEEFTTESNDKITGD